MQLLSLAVHFLSSLRPPPGPGRLLAECFVVAVLGFLLGTLVDVVLPVGRVSQWSLSRNRAQPPMVSTPVQAASFEPTERDRKASLDPQALGILDSVSGATTDSPVEAFSHNIPTISKPPTPNVSIPHSSSTPTNESAGKPQVSELAAQTEDVVSGGLETKKYEEHAVGDPFRTPTNPSTPNTVSSPGTSSSSGNTDDEVPIPPHPSPTSAYSHSLRCISTMNRDCTTPVSPPKDVPEEASQWASRRVLFDAADAFDSDADLDTDENDSAGGTDSSTPNTPYVSPSGKSASDRPASGRSASGRPASGRSASERAWSDGSQSDSGEWLPCSPTVWDDVFCARVEEGKDGEGLRLDAEQWAARLAAEISFDMDASLEALAESPSLTRPAEGVDAAAELVWPSLAVSADLNAAAGAVFANASGGLPDENSETLREETQDARCPSCLQRRARSANDTCRNEVLEIGPWSNGEQPLQQTVQPIVLHVQNTSTISLQIRVVVDRKPEAIAASRSLTSSVSSHRA